MSELEPELETTPIEPDVVAIPQELAVLPLRDTVVFPESMTPLAIGQERSIKLVDDVVGGDRMLALLTTRDPENEQPGFKDLYEVGTAAVIHKMIRVPDGTLRILVQGLRRIRLEEPVQVEPYLVGRFVEVPDVVEETPEVEALTRNVQALFARIIALVPYLPEELELAAANVDDPSALCHLVASTLRLKTEEKQELLEDVSVEQRLRHVSRILNRELEVFELGTRIQSQVQSEMEKGQREFFLRQQLKAIQDELGESDPERAEVEELRERLLSTRLPEDVHKAAERELSRLERLPSAAAEHGVIRTYLEWILTLPWDVSTPDDLDLEHAQTVLDQDHYDLEKVKERIIEYLAVSKLKDDLSGPILCFVGPPGVGKTSLGHSIANTLGRKFVRISVGGVRDEAEIRGHRRTYIGAMPGTIIRALRDAESRNPVFLIDEIDKMGNDFRGDPSSAMLEVLDPEQHSTFRDHYLDLPFDLSKVLFICTANTTDTIPSPLLDRMDVIQLSGYTEDEKFGIARKYLIPKQLRAHGLTTRRVAIHDKALRLVIREYTREAGVRNLERQIAALLRKAATQIARGAAEKLKVDEARAREWLGPRRFSHEVRKRTSEPGVATGLAWTPAGGEILFIEAGAYDGKGRLKLTGQLSEVMQESAQTAFSWVRSRAVSLQLDPGWFAVHDVHIHVPAGAVPKDGPSAGVAMATAIVSLVTGRPVANDVGMTGEVTLTGQVLPIGGVREKVLAAQRAGLKRVILPRENGSDLEELPEDAREAMEFVLADELPQVLAAALDGKAPVRVRRAQGTERRAARGR
ncbi:MAG: ATP-dependent Lon protease [Gaiellaceae bacterium]|jgi:ATP-dependent Lon protease|nr:ATP-dependent Lon protease [Gaiellaceae bacterium]